MSAPTTQQSKQSFQSPQDASATLKLGDVFQMPLLHQTRGSLSALEKCQLGILISAIRPKVIVETGVWRGATTRFLSEFLQLNSLPGFVYGFDLPEIIDELIANDQFFASADNVRFVKGTLPHSLAAWLTSEHRNIDLALIDANHSFYSVYSELSLIAPRLAADGYIFCHDYGKPGTTFDRVMCAVNEFSRLNGFSVIPFYGQDDSRPDLKCEAAILHRPVKASFGRRVFCWRKYFAESYPRVSRAWGSLRDKVGW
jgi:hypothetical protein